MSHEPKSVEHLTIADFEEFPLWEFTDRDTSEFGELEVTPVNQLPVKSLAGRLVGTRVSLANHDKVFAVLGNIDAKNPRATRQFITLEIRHKHRRFGLARYFDPWWSRNGPDALAKFLALPIDSIFPIRYDVSQYCLGDRAALVGEIEREPREKLSTEERIALALELHKE